MEIKQVVITGQSEAELQTDCLNIENLELNNGGKVVSPQSKLCVGLSDPVGESRNFFRGRVGTQVR